MKYYLKFNGRYLAKSGHTHGHPKTTILKENARTYTSEIKAILVGRKYFGNTAKIDTELVSA
jgi:SRSO17 transposase